MHQSKYHAFTIVDLLVYMAIVAVLIGLAFAGINIVQRSSRDNERKVITEQIQSAVNDYFRSTSAYPVENTTLVWTTASVTVGSKTIDLPGFKNYSTTATDSTRTRYAYFKDRSGYILCAKLESGSWFRTGQGGDSLSCPTN